ncbi:cobaltochelatase subunit CobN [Pelomonas cellulosilytica]|uniref:Cobaltochelatase subunit CobN n=1 Tax=Pelomonas cellulosilytica TaxID=2906762 RepID=A0ABS8Y0H5_9BURK|nr:cobaltochelatase subunit CobN [Pelomonas sp. P8]MCE4557035.1 cobaltochelatase subunit CobN [Pelomonas sp. P8]
MTRRLRTLGLLMMLALAGGRAWAAAAPRLLFISVDVTPAAKHALIDREGRAAGFSVQQLEYPLRGAALAPTQEQALQKALGRADWVWVDVPHASAEARLRPLLDAPLRQAARPGARVLWIPPGEPAAGDAGLRAYLQAGGPANTRAAFALARSQWAGQPPPALAPPQPIPQRGIYHPGAPGLFANAAEFRAWAAQQGLRGEPVALLLHRYHFVQGDTAWLDRWLALFRQRGVLAYAAFSSQWSAAPLAQLLEQDGRLQARVVVNHALLTQGANLQPTFERWGVPVLQTQPYRQDAAAVWEASETGLAQADIPFYFAQPEAAGLIDPVVVVAHPKQGEAQLIERQAASVAAKAAHWIALQAKPNADKRLVAFVYNYPPGGSNFGASFLNVPRSLARVSEGLQAAGYAVTPRAETDWINDLKPLLSAYYPGADLRALLDAGQAEALPLTRYQAWFDALPAAVREPIVARWGAPASSRYVLRWRGEPVFVIPRLQLGALAVLPQPPREETLRLGQDPFMHRSKTPLSHHYLATYLWARQADAVIHFGTHGTQEWAPGKLRGPDVLDPVWLPLGDVPVIYPYIVDNLGEALTAKRRGRALMVSHRTPSFAPAGFNARMAHMHELMHEWETVDPGPTRQRLERDMTQQFVEHNLHHDLGWTTEQIAANFAGFLELLHPWLDRLAQSSQPQGLAVFGSVPDEAQRRGSILQWLRVPLIEALGEDIDEAFLINHEGVAQARPARWLALALQDAEAASLLDLRPSACMAASSASTPAASGACGDGFVPNRAARKPIDSAALRELALRAQQMWVRLGIEGEMPGLLRALDGRFLPAAYGGDLLRNPESLPTGRNLTGLDPNRLPTRQAYEAAQALFKRWYAEQARSGRAPQRLALSLWAGETLRHQGVMEAQALVALGARPIWDTTGRPTSIELLPPAELGRPRVDVLLSVTGSYRDQFPALMKLLDQAVATVARAEPGNAIAQNNAAVERELRRAGVKPAQARALALARVFGNPAGDYGTGIADAVQSDGLQTRNGQADPRLGQLFLNTMSQPYVDGEPLAVPAAQARQALGAHLRHTDAALMSRSSHLYAMVSSDDPFQYLGGLTAAAKVAGKAEDITLHVSQLQDAAEQHTETAAQALALEMQTRYLHPGWLKAQQAEGWAGALQVLKAVQYSFGWQHIAPGTVRADHWQSFYDVLVQDKHRLGVPQWLRQNPQAYAQTLERLIQAERLGYWQPDAATRQQLAQQYRDLTRQAPLANELAGVRRWAEGQQPQTVVTPTAAQAQTHGARATPGPAPSPTPAVRGLQLQAQPAAETPSKTATAASLLSQALAGTGMLLLVAGGAAWQGRRRPQPELHHV